MKFRPFRILLSALLGIICLYGCKKSEPDMTSGPVVKYLTCADKSHLFEKSGYDFGSHGAPAKNVVTLDRNVKYQTIDGFGPAMTGASCYNLLRMSAEDRQDFLKKIFDPREGIGCSLIRVSIGASDFSVGAEFTWCDMSNIRYFDIPSEDKEYLIPVLKEIFAINPDIKIIGSPWSAPRWMTTKPDQWASGNLKPECYDDYALYFVKWIQAMQKYGFDIYAVTPQNEPLNGGNSMSMIMSWQQQRDFVAGSLGKALAEAGLKTKILAYDHNYDQYTYPMNIFADSNAAKYFAGSAWHDYNSGDVNMLKHVVAAYPDKEIYFTESSIGDWNHKGEAGFSDCVIRHYERNFLGTMYYGCKGVTLWNLILDTKNGPHRGKGACSTCYGVATMDRNTKKIVAWNSQYYNLAHASKVVRPGAVRIGAEGYSPDGVLYGAAVNKDGSTAVLILNKSAKTHELVFKSGKEVYVSVPPSSLVSLEWNEAEEREIE